MGGNPHCYGEHMNTIETYTTTNRRYLLEEGDNLYIERLSRSKGYQINNAIRLRDLCPNARHIIDIGANIGNNTIEYATWAKQVSSFEPTPHTYQWLKDNVEYNRHNWGGGRETSWYHNESLEMTAKVDLYNNALGNKEENILIVNHPRNAGHNHLRKGKWVKEKSTGKYTKWIDGVWNPLRSQNKSEISVEVKTLDSYNFQEVDIIKMDIEGWELYALQGAEDTINRCRPIIQIEIMDSSCRRAGYTSNDIVKWFNAHNYVRTLRDGRVIEGDNYEMISGFMDSFYIPAEKHRFNQLFDKKDK